MILLSVLVIIEGNTDKHVRQPLILQFEDGFTVTFSQGANAIL